MIAVVILLLCASFCFGWAFRAWYDRRLMPRLPEVTISHEGNVYYLPLRSRPEERES